MCVSGCPGKGISCRKKLKVVGESIDPCVTPLGKHLFVVDVPSRTAQSSLPVTKVDNHFL